MVDGPARKAMLVADMGRGHLIHAPAVMDARTVPSKLLFCSGHQKIDEK